MTKRVVTNQIDNLTLGHYNLKNKRSNDIQLMCVIWHWRSLVFKGYNFSFENFSIGVFIRNLYELTSLWSS
jgi:hypothetical protein